VQIGVIIGSFPLADELSDDSTWQHRLQNIPYKKAQRLQAYMMNVVDHTTSILVLLAPKVVCCHGTAIDLLAAVLFAGERDLCNSSYASHTKQPFIASMLQAFGCSEASSKCAQVLKANCVRSRTQR
jgi:hypothetical protein